MPRTGENIYQRNDGRYEGRYIASRDENGKARYKSVYGDTKEEVRVKLAEARTVLEKEYLAGITTFEEAYREWIKKRRMQVTEASADRYEYLLERFILPKLGKMDVEQISAAQVGVLALSLTNKEERGEGAISASVAETLLGFTNSIIAFAKGDEDAVSIFKKGKKQKSEKSHYQPLSSDEIRRLVSYSNIHRSPIMLGVLIALYTGIGTGELCALSWNDVDKKRREIYIHNTLYRVKDREGEAKRTKLTIIEAGKGRIRTLSYPKELDAYVNEFYRKGTVFLTGEKGRYIEQRTFCNHLERAFSSCGFEKLTLQRVSRTYKDGLSDVRYLQDPFYSPEDGIPTVVEVNEKWLLKEMENDLSPLRAILGLSGAEMGQMIGFSESEYLAIESGEQPLDWHSFMSLLFFFRYNAKTEGVVDALGLYPQNLKDKLSIKTGQKDRIYS